MIFLMPKPSKKKILRRMEFLLGLHQAQTLAPLITQYEAFKKKQKNKYDFSSKYWFA